MRVKTGTMGRGSPRVPPTGPGGVLPAGAAPGDTLVWDGAAWRDGFPNIYQGQAAWFVDSAAGSDQNDGATLATALATLDNLGQRLYRARWSQDTTITLKGSFAGKALRLEDVAVAPTKSLLVTGLGTTLYSGSVTAHTNYTNGTNAPTITDAAVGDFSPYLDKRVRLTSGASVGATAFIEKVLAPTQVMLSSWQIQGARVNAANGDTFVIEDLVAVDAVDIETLATPGASGLYIVNGLALAGFGSARVGVNTMLFDACAIDVDGFGEYAFDVAAMTGSYLRGAAGSSFVLRGDWEMQSCGSSTNVAQIFVDVDSTVTIQECLWQSVFTLNHSATLLMDIDNAVQNAANVGSFNGALFLNPGSFASLESGQLWGVNTTTNGIVVKSDATFQYITSVPTIAGATNNVNLGGNLMPYGSMPIQLSRATFMKVGARLPTALEVAASLANATTVAVAFPVGVTLNGTAYLVEPIYLAPTGTPAGSPGFWATAKTTTGFTYNVKTASGAGTAYNFTLRILN